MAQNKTKLILLIALTLILIVGIWLITLKFNLQNGWRTKENQNGLSFSQLIDEIDKIIQKSPLSKKNESGQTNLSDLSQKIAEKIKTFQATETENWQTYQNQDYKFEFKYPNSFDCKEELEQAKIRKLNNEIGSIVLFSCINNTGFLNIQEVNATLKKDDIKKYANVEGVSENMIVGEQTAYKYLEKGDAGISDNVLVVIPLNNSTLLIRFYSTQGTQNPINENFVLIDQILATLKFLE